MRRLWFRDIPGHLNCKEVDVCHFFSTRFFFDEMNLFPVMNYSFRTCIYITCVIELQNCAALLSVLMLTSFFPLLVSSFLHSCFFYSYSHFSDSQEVTARVFMPLFECPSQRCRTNQTKGNLILQLRASKFLKFQEVFQLLLQRHC